MSTASYRNTVPLLGSAKKTDGLKVSAYERAASTLLSLLIIVGVAFAFLFVAWLGSRIIIHKKPVKVTADTGERIQQVGGGISSGIVGESMELNSPIWQDVAGETDIVEPNPQEAFAQVVNTVASRRAVLADPQLMDNLERRGGTKQKGTGNRPGYGHGPGWPGLPPHERWEIRFPAGNTLESYAMQLDFFGISLGVLEKGGKITMISDLSERRPKIETKPRSDVKNPVNGEPLMWMQWRKGSDLIEADKRLAQRAGAQSDGKTILQFYPDATEQKLLRLELNFRGIDAGRIKKTVFAVIPADEGWDFEVVSQSRL